MIIICLASLFLNFGFDEKLIHLFISFLPTGELEWQFLVEDLNFDLFYPLNDLNFRI
jgi:hypothetical protein